MKITQICCKSGKEDTIDLQEYKNEESVEINNIIEFSENSTNNLCLNRDITVKNNSCNSISYENIIHDNIVKLCLFNKS